MREGGRDGTGVLSADGNIESIFIKSLFMLLQHELPAFKLLALSSSVNKNCKLVNWSGVQKV